MTFFICVFILVMQGLWRYSDDIVGKGLDISVLLQLLFYVALQTVPMALPLAILLAALMTFGNLGENYELTALKASGISLWRIMRPLVLVTIVICGVAFWFNNNMLPVANLKFYTILYSVRQSRPEIDIKPKTFSEIGDNFRVKIDSKDPDSGMMYGLIIHDHRDGVNHNMNATMADSGRMDVLQSLGVVALTLYSGVTYDEKVALGTSRLSERDRQMYRHDQFQKQRVLVAVDGLGGFSLQNNDFLSTNDRMKDLGQLISDVDSLKLLRDSLTNIVRISALTSNARRARSYYNSDIKYAFAIDSALSIPSVDSLALSVTPAQRKMALETALRNAKSQLHAVEEHNRLLSSERIKLNRHQMEEHRKFTMPIACLLFFFIGAPLGAIIRKGGLGLPLVISVIFFIFYYVIDTFGAKMARESVWPVPNGMWMSTSILFVIGIFLTYKSATDSDLFNVEAYSRFFKKYMPATVRSFAQGSRFANSLMGRLKEGETVFGKPDEEVTIMDYLPLFFSPVTAPFVDLWNNLTGKYSANKHQDDESE